MPDRKKTQVRAGGRTPYTAPSGPSISRMKDVLGDNLRWVMAILLAAVAISTVVMFSGTGSAGLGGGGESDQSSGDQTVATVNGTAITRSQVENAAAGVAQQQEMFGGPPPGISGQAMIYGNSLQQIVEQNVWLEAARSSNQQVSDADYNAALNKQVDAMVQQEISSYQSPAVFQKHLQMTGKTMADIRKEMRDQLLQSQQSRGIDVHQAITDQLLLQKFADVKEHSLSLPRMVRYSHVVISSTPKTDAAARAQADLVGKQARAGTDFAKLVKQYSSDKATASRGGDVGWVTVAGQFVPDYLKPLAKARVGDLVGPVKTPSGYEIMKVTGFTTRLPATIHTDQSQSTDPSVQSLVGAASQAFETYIQNLAKKARVTYNDLGLAGAVAQLNNENKTALADYKAALAQKSMPSRERAWVAYAAGQLILTQNPAKTTPAEQRQALAYFQQSVNAQPSSEGWLAVGDAQSKLGQNKLALAAYRSAITGAAGKEMVLVQLMEKFQSLNDRADLAKVTKLIQEAGSQGGGSPFGLGGGAGGPGGSVPVRLAPSRPSTPAPKKS